MREFIVDALEVPSYEKQYGRRHGIGLIARLAAFLLLAAVSGRAGAQTFTNLLSFTGTGGAYPDVVRHGQSRSGRKPILYRLGQVYHSGRHDNFFCRQRPNSSNRSQTTTATLTVLDHAAAAFAGGGGTLALNFGTVQLGGTRDLQYQIEDLPATFPEEKAHV